ncbi:MAG TPA: MlaD family protein [Bacteroidales bacterium]|nr:MlaD family protein [Bacteroidales bacterium]HQI70762.1 MlaD family protein [Bacteroidales bacterium]
MKISKEVKIAIVFIVGLALLYWGINFLKGRDLFKKERTFYAVYNQVDGLVKANPVLVNGFRVGQVDDIRFHPDNSGRIIVKLKVTNNDLMIPANTEARIISSDILGSRAVELKRGDATTEAKSGDTLSSSLQATLSQTVNVQFQPVKQKFENVMTSLDSVLVIIKSVFNENTRRNLEQSFESIRFTIRNLEHTTYNIDTLVTNQRSNLSGIISNVESISENIKNNNDKIQNIIKNFSDISDTIAQSNIASTINNADKSLKSFSEIVDKVNRGEGTLGMLIYNDSLYNNLEKSSKELNELVEDIKLNPHRYLNFSVFGPSKKKNQYTPAKE